MATSRHVHTTIIPAAGLGTRLLPITVTVPKELLPLVDRPIVQYGVEEAVRSGVDQIVLITNPGSLQPASHFAPQLELERILTERGHTELLTALRSLRTMATVTTLHQDKPLGLGDAVLAGRPSVGNEPFAVMLPDNIIDSDPPALQQMLDVFAELREPVLLFERVASHTVDRYGIITGELVRDNLFRVVDLVEKPTTDEAPSNFAIIGRYVLTPDIFHALESTKAGHGSEVQLTDALRLLLQDRPIYALELQGSHHDVGTKIGFLKATLHFALKHPELAPSIEAALERVTKNETRS